MALILATLLLCGGLATPMEALGPGPQPDAEAEQRDLTRLSIEELANIQVESVSRRREARIEAAGAVHVITEEDIRRSGISTLPDAVRLSPGVQSSRIDADEWALSVRGFASRLSRSVLVTLDGRSLWTPLFAGVFWDQHDTSLLDLDRIEVSRGPYGALFGANAVNGVISIVSKSADRTHGGLLSVGIGTAEQIGTLRYGGELRPGLHYRAWGQYRRRDGTTAVADDAYDDRWTIATGGFRSDWMRGDDTFTVGGGVTDVEAGQPATVAFFTPPFSRTIDGDVDFRGGHLLARWQHGFAGGDHVAVQAYYDRARRREAHYMEIRDTVDLDAQHRVAWGGRHDFVWGFSARRSHGDFRGRFPTLAIEPAHRADDIASVFAQDEVRAGRLRLAAGAKGEWNDYSGWHLQPSVRAGVLLAERHNVWAAVSRGVRTSSRVERDLVLYASIDPERPLVARLVGSDAFRSESVVSYEAGYKARLGARVYFDVSGFHAVYDDLATNEVGAPVLEPGEPPAPARVVLPVVVGNGQEGTSSGVEASATAVLRPGWRVQAAHSFLRVNQSPLPGTTDFNEGFERNSPRHQFWAASYLTIGEDTDLDLTLRRIGAIPGHRVEAYTELDARVAWRPREGLELALVGQNLLHPRHPEFGGGFAIDRAVRVRAGFEW